MVSLKINGPRRRESERAKNRRQSDSPAPSEQPAASSRATTSSLIPQSSKMPKVKLTSGTSAKRTSTPTASRGSSASNATPASSPTGDTIAVHHRPAPAKITVDPNAISQLAAIKARRQTAHEKAASHDAGDPSAHKKTPKRDSSTPKIEALKVSAGPSKDDADDSVSEYEFHDDVEDVEDEDEDDGQDTKWYKPSKKIDTDVITISSDSERDDYDEGWDLSRRPWKQFDRKMREQWEMMYCHVTDYAMNGDWTVTEDYQREKDKEMLRYVEDFPLPQWIVPQDVASGAYDRLIERTRWRSLGIRIYGRERIPEFFPGSTKALAGPSSLPHGQPARQAPQAPSHSPMMPPSLQHHPHSGPISSSMPQSMSQRPPPSMVHSQSMPPSMPAYANGLPPHGQLATPSMPPMMPPHLPYGPMYHPNVPPPQASTGIPVNITAKRKPRAKKNETPPAGGSKIAGPIPPYPKRVKPAERGNANRSGGRKGKAAQAEEFPWNRDLDFVKAKANATWDDSIYDPITLTSMAEIRVQNGPIIERIDAEEADRQRRTRNARKSVSKDDGASETEQVKERAKGGGRKKASTNPDGGPSDSYHSGYFCFVPKDQPKVIALGNRTPDEILLEAEEGKIPVEECAELMICFSPGKKGGAQDLHQARFSIKDVLLTRQQIAQCPILVPTAAERIVDFCPDMLWRSMLLRISSEAGKGNKWVRDRMCLNGNYCDKATITKRIGSALGQKQQQSMAARAKRPQEKPWVEKDKGLAQAEADYYNENSIDHGHYIAFFGLRSSHRSQLILSQQESKRKAIDLDESSGAETKPKSSKKRRIVEEEIVSSSDAKEMSSEVETGAEGEGSADEADESNGDAVSVQSDTVLDQLDDD